jgi:Cytochrome c
VVPFKRAVAFALAALCAGGITVGARAQDAPPGDIVNGKRLYLNGNCFTCHGRAGQGGAYNGPAPAVAKTAMPFEGFFGPNSQPIERHAGLCGSSDAGSGRGRYLRLRAVIARATRG